jgi:hypothetical protein
MGAEWSSDGASLDGKYVGINHTEYGIRQGTANIFFIQVMGYSSDFMPHVGQIPDKSGQFIIAGFTGHGMPRILLSSKGIASMIRNNKDFDETGVPQAYKVSKTRLTSPNNELLESLKGFWESKPML